MKGFIIISGIMYASIGFSQDFVVSEKTNELNGYENGLQSVWFSPDDQHLYGDESHIVCWNILEKQLISKQIIPGTLANPSSTNESMKWWIKGNTRISDPDQQKKSFLYNNLNVYDFQEKSIYSTRLNDFLLISSAFVYDNKEILAIVKDVKKKNTRLLHYDFDNHIVLGTIASANAEDKMTTVYFSSDEAVIAIGYSGSQPRIELYNFLTHTFIKSYATKHDVIAMDGVQNLVIAGGGNELYFINLKTAELISTLQTNVSVFDVAISPNGKTAVTGSRATGADIIDLSEGTVQHFYDGAAQCFAFSHDGKTLAIGLYKTTATVESPSVVLFYNTNSSVESINTSLDNATKWHHYSQETPNFEIDFPSTPKVEEVSDLHEMVTQRISCVYNQMEFLVQIKPSTIKEKQKSITKHLNAITENYLSTIEGKSIQRDTWEYADGLTPGNFVQFEKKSRNYVYANLIREGYVFEIIHSFPSNSQGLGTKFITSFRLKP